MVARLQLALAAVLALVALALGGVLLFGGTTSGATRTLQLGPTGFAGFTREVAAPRDFTLDDQDGRRRSLADDRGKVTILTFLYTHCEDTCPVMASIIRSAMDDLGHDVPAYAVSVDPSNDTPESARAFLLRQGLNGRMAFLLGSRSALLPVWHEYGISPQNAVFDGKKYDHNAYVVLIDKHGVQRVSFPYADLTTDGLVHDLRKLLAEPA